MCDFGQSLQQQQQVPMALAQLQPTPNSQLKNVEFQGSPYDRTQALLGQIQRAQYEDANPQPQLNRHNPNYGHTRNDRAAMLQQQYLQQHGINTIDDLRRLTSQGQVPLNLAQMLAVQHFGVR